MYISGIFVTNKVRGIINTILVSCPHLQRFYLFLERGEGAEKEEGNMDVREKH